MGAKKAATTLAHVYQHTHIAVYLVGFFAIACLFYDSTQVGSCVKQEPWLCQVLVRTVQQSHSVNVPNYFVLKQGIVQKYELNRKWFYLYGASVPMWTCVGVERKNAAHPTHRLGPLSTVIF